MTDFVLVHGAWCGAWTYERTAADLRAAGHRVLVADLTGLGNRKEEFHPGITLSMHIDDVVDQIKIVGFDRFVLVGHSWGGMVITGVATKVGAQIDALVYIDAFLPEDGQALWDLTSEWEHRHYIDSQKHAPGAVPPLPGLEHPAMTPQPLLTLLESIRFTGEETKVPKRTYVFATAWQPSPFGRFAQKVESDPAWCYFALPSSHDVMSDQPEQLLSILLGQK